MHRNGLVFGRSTGRSWNALAPSVAFARALALSVLALVPILVSSCGGGGGGGGTNIPSPSGTPLLGKVTIPTSVQPIPIPGIPAAALGEANVSGATVEILDADGNQVKTATTDSDGKYSVTLADGSYQVGIQVGTTTHFSPLRSVIIVRDGNVDGTTDSGGTATLDFELPEGSQSISGTVTAASAGVADVRVQFVDQDTNLVRFQVTTDSSGAFSATTVPLGSFTVRLDSTSIPSGYASPTPKNLSVTASGASPSSIAFTLQTATTTTGTLTSTSGVAPIPSLSPEGLLQPGLTIEAPLQVPDGTVVVISEVGYGEVARFTIGSDGSYSLDLRDGTYLVTFLGLGTDVVAPAPIQITVKNGLIYTEDSDTAVDPSSGGTIDSSALDVSATLTGTVTRSGSPVTIQVVAIDTESGATLAKATTDANGQYSLPLADGSYDIGISPGLLPSGVVPPTKVRVAVESDTGTPFKESNGTANDGVVDFTLGSSSVSLSGTVADDSSNALKDVRIVAKRGAHVLGRAVTAADGSYTLRLPLGTIDISIIPESVPTGLLSPDATRVEVAQNGSSIEITDDTGTITQLNMILAARAANVTGTVKFDFDGNSTLSADEVVGCTIVVRKPDATQKLFSVPTNPDDGSYSLVLPNGSYKISVDPDSVPPGSTPPAVRRVSVTDSGVTLADGTTGSSVTVDFTLIPRSNTVEGMVSLDGTGVGVGVRVIDKSTDTVINSVRTNQLTGAYRIPVPVGSYQLRVNPDTVPSGAAIPNPVAITVAADGTVSTDSGALSNPPTVNIALTRTVAELTGTTKVSRSGSDLPVEVLLEVRDPLDQTVLFEFYSSPEDGSYSTLLQPGSWAIGVNGSSLPPGVLPPAPVTVTVSGSTVSGTGVSSNTKNFVLNDTRASGVDVYGFVVNDSGQGIPAELRLFDPGSGDAVDNYLLSVLTKSDGSFSMRAVDGSYELAVLPDSLPPTAIPPANVLLSVSSSTVYENNTKTSGFAFTETSQDFTANATNDGKIGFLVRDGAASGITINGAITDSSSNTVPFVRIEVYDTSTSELVLELFSDFENGAYSTLLPLGSYKLVVDPDSLPTGFAAPDSKSVQAVDTGSSIVVTTNGGASVSAVGGAYPFSFTLIDANQSVTGTVLDAGANGIRAFVEVVDSVDGTFVAGRWSAESTGAYSVTLGAGAYKVRIDADTVAFGTTTPAPVGVTVTSSSVLEDSGTGDDGVVNFQLASASRTISGTVLDGSSNPFGGFVIAKDIVSDLIVGGSPVNPADGSYSISLAPGSYQVSVDPNSLPPGFVPSAPTTVSVVDSSQTLNFTVTIATSCITGRIVTASSEVPLAVFVKLLDASTSEFVAGVPTDFDTGSYSLCVPPGNYKIKIDSASLPDGAIAPAAQSVQVLASSFVESNTTTFTGSGSNSANDGIMHFLVDDTDVGTLAQVGGNVTLDPGALPLGAFVVLEDSTSGDFVAGTFSDPGNGGAYSLTVPSGNYRLVVDPGSLPPGLILPDAVTLSASGTQLSIQTSDGVTEVIADASTSGTPGDVDIVLTEPTNSVSGTVTLNSVGFSAVIQVINPDTDFIVFDLPTAPDGAYSMVLPDGSFVIRVAPWSLPPTLTPPSPVSISLSGGFAIETAGTANDGIVPFALSDTSSTLTGYVVNDASERLFANVFIVDPSTGQFIMEAYTTPNQEFSFQVIDATFDIVVEPSSLPSDVVPPIPSRLTLSGGTFTLDDAGSGTMVDADTISIIAAQSSSLTALPVKLQQSGTPVAGAVRVLDASGNLLFFLDVPPTSGGADLFLSDGTYTLKVDPYSIPPSVAVPANKTLVVSSGGTSFTVDGTGGQSLVLFSLVAPTLQGTIVNAFLGGSQLVDLDLYDGSGQLLTPNGITLTQSGSNARYGDSGDVLVADGTYKLRLSRASGQDATTVVLPSDKTVNVLNGVIQNPDDDLSTGAVVDINMTVPVVQGTVSGSVTQGSAVVGLTVGARDPVTLKIINSAVTDSSGNYAFGVPAGTFDLTPTAASLAAIAPSAVPPTPVAISVSASASITIIGVGACTGNPNCTGIDFSLTSFDSSTTAQVTGTVTSTQTPASSATPVSGASVFLVDTQGVPFGSTTTASGGTYTLIVPDGNWYVYVDIAGLSLGYPIVPPPPTLISASGAGSQTVDVNINGATGMINGQVMTDAFVGVGARLVVTAASATEIPDGFVYDIFTTPNGSFFAPVGAGSFKLWVDPGSLPPGFLPPTPTNFTVSSTSITESNTFGTGNNANDGKINPRVAAGGATIRAVVYAAGTTNPISCFVGLLEPASNPSDPPFFLFGQPTDPTTGIVNFTAEDGSYYLEVDPSSLPPDQQSGGRIEVTVSGGVVSFESGTATTSIDPGSGSGVDHAILYVSTAAGALSGLVRTDLSDASTSLSALVVAVDATTGAFVRNDFTSPADGAYAMALGSGTYDVFVEPGSLPPSQIAPAPVRVTVSGSTVSESYGTADDGVVSFQISSAAQTLTGYVRDSSGTGTFALVGLFAPDSSGDYEIFVTGAEADFETGLFSIPVSPGTYQVRVDPFSIPPGAAPPPAVTISVTSSSIGYGSGTTETSGSTTYLILSMQTLAGGVSGSVLNTSGAGVPCFVVAEESASEVFMGGAPTATDGSYSISLPAGSYKIYVDPPSLPGGSVPPPPHTVTVSSSVVTDVNFTTQTVSASDLFEGFVLTQDSTAVDCSSIPSGRLVPPVPVRVYQPSPDGSPPTFLMETVTSPTNGYFALPLGDGTYNVAVDGAALPPGMLPPAPITVTRSGSTFSVSGTHDTCTDDSTQIILEVATASATFTGIVQDSSSNPIGCFVELTQASDGAFVAGQPTAPGDGSFAMALGASTYELRVDPYSLPPGFASPPPTTMSVSSGTIQVDAPAGVSWSSGTSTLTITLSQASASVSGTVLDTSSNPISCQMKALDFDGAVIATAWTNGSGAYTLSLSPDIYTIKVAGTTLPAGYMAPPSQSVDLISSATATANFTVATAPATISGSLADSRGTGVPGFVVIQNAINGEFVAGTDAVSDGSGNFTYSIPIGAGTFTVGVDPTSVLSTLVVPSPVGFSVTINGVTGQAQIAEDDQGDGSSTTDGVIDFVLSATSQTLAGKLADASSNPVQGSVFVELADGSGIVVAEASTDPDGLFSLSFANGNFKLKVDPGSLPPLHLAPPPISVTVTSSAILLDGSAPTGPPHVITIPTSDATLNGHVYQSDGSTPVQGAFVEAIESTSGAFVSGDPTDSSGVFTLPLSNGTYLVQLDPMSLASGLIPPAPTQIHVNSGSIYLGSDTSGTDITSSGLDLQVASPAASVTVSTLDGYGGGVSTQVNVRDAASDALVTTAFTDSSGSATIGLPAGSYLVRIPAFTVPPGVMAPPPVSLTVSGGGTTTDSSGLPADGIIQFVFQAAAASISGTVSLEAGGTVAGLRLMLVDSEEDFVIAESTTGPDGTYILDTGVGEFDLVVDSPGVPASAVIPAPIPVIVGGGGSVDPGTTIDIALLTSVGTATGTVSLDSTGTESHVAAFRDNSGTWEMVSGVDTDSSGAYSMRLPSGSCVLLADFDLAALGDPEIIAPLPVAQDGSTNPTVNLGYFTVAGGSGPAHEVLKGNVTAAGAPFDAGMTLYYNSMPMALYEADAGAYRMPIMADASRTFVVGVFEDDLPSSFTAPSSVSITVDGSATPAISGTGVTEDTSTSPSEWVLDFTISVNGLALGGTITDWNSTPLSGVEVRTFVVSTGSQGATALTDSSGHYALILPAGEYELELGGGLPATAIRPAPAEVVVVDSSGTLSMTVDGVSTQTKDYQLEEAAARLSGQITVASAPSDAEVIAYVGGSEVAFNFAQGGTYEILLPAGDVVVLAEAFGISSSMLLPAPYSATITDTGSLQQLTHDFAFVDSASNPGETLQGSVMSDGSGIAAEIEIHDSSGAPYGFTEASGSGNFAVSLPPATYTVRVASDDVPSGATGGTSAQVTVTDGDISSPAMPDDTLFFILNTTGTVVSGTVTDASSSPAQDVIIFFESFSSQTTSFVVTDGSGAYSVKLAAGDYEAVLSASTLPSGSVLPPETELTVASTPITLNFALQAADGTVSGSVTLDGSATDATIFALDANLDEVAMALTDGNGSYTLGLPSGSYTVIAELDDDSLDISTILSPSGVSETVTSGSTATADFAFTTASGADSTLSIQVTQAGSTHRAEGHLDIDSGGGFQFFHLWETHFGSGQHSAQVALADGTYQVNVDSVEDNDVIVDAVTIVVGSGAISSGGSALAGNLLQIELPGQPSGELILADGTSGASSTISMIPVAGGSATTATSDGNGEFDFSGLADGHYWMAASAVSSGAVAHARVVVVESGQAYPPVVVMQQPPLVGTITGQVTVNGTGAQATVYAFDRGLRVAAIAATDGSGNYTLPLAGGTYTFIAQLASPGGTEVPPVPTATTVTTDATVNIAFATATASQTLSGQALVEGAAEDVVVLVYKDGATPAPVALVFPDGSGNYSVKLPYDTLEVEFLPASVPVAVVSFPPVSLTIDGTGIAGTDLAGAAISGGVLALDPLASTDDGNVRKAFSDLLDGFMDRDGTALNALIDITAMWNGDNKAQIIADWTTDVDDETADQVDFLMGEVTGTGDLRTLEILTGRVSRTDSDGELRAWTWDNRLAGHLEYEFTIQRADASSPWLFAGNGLHVDEVLIDSLSTSIVAGSSSTETGVEYNVQETSTFPLSSAAVSGTGITDGTLTESTSGGDSEWSAFLDAAGSQTGPSPFAGTYGSLTDGGTYTFAIDYGSGTENITVNYFTPTSSLYPTAVLGVDSSSGELEIGWGDLSAQLDRPYAYAYVELEEDPDGAASEIYEDDELPIGRTETGIDGELFTIGTEYSLVVGVADQGGAIVEYEVHFTYPPADVAGLHGTVADGSSSPLSGYLITATPSSGSPVMTTSASDGSYSMLLAPGTYTVSLDDQGAGGVLPSDHTVVVTDSSGTISMAIDGSASATGQLDWTVETVAAQLSGAVTLDGSGAGATVSAYASGALVSSVTSSSGSYTIDLPVGDVTVIAQITSVHDALYPDPYVVTVTDTGSVQSLSHDFAFTTSGATVLQGSTTSNGSAYSCDVWISNSSQQLVAVIASTGSWSAGLADGTYTLSVPISQLPAGYTGASAATVVIGSGSAFGAGVQSGTHYFAFDTTGNDLTGTVIDSSQSPVSGVIVQATPTSGTIRFGVTNGSGQYAINLPSGSYLVEILSQSVPSGTVYPPSQELSIAGDRTLNFELDAAAGSASGTVTIDGSGSMALISVVDSDGEMVTEMQTAADGTYTVPMPAGTYTLFATLTNGDPTQTITPDPLSATISGGTTLTGQDFAFVSTGGATASQTLSGTLTRSGSAAAGVIEIVTLVSGIPLTYAIFETQTSGSDEVYAMALSTGDYEISVIQVGGEEFSWGPYEITVSASDIQMDSVALSGGVLDIAIPALSGTLRNASSVVASATVSLIPLAGGSTIDATTDSNGEYSFATLSSGDYRLTINAAALGGGEAMPPLRDVYVTSTGSLPYVADIGIPTSAGTLSGAVTVDASGVQSTVYIYDGEFNVVQIVATDGSGNYSIPLAAGTYTVLAEIDSPTGSEVPPVLQSLAFTTTATFDVAFTTTASSQTLTGTETLNTTASSLPILIYKAGTPPVPVARVIPAGDGTYSVKLPYDTLEVVLAPDTLSSTVVGFAPLSLTIDGSGIAGNDMDGVAISGNQLDIDPYSANDPGKVRKALGDFLAAGLQHDLSTLSSLLSDSTLWNGYDKSGALESLLSEDPVFAIGQRVDRIQTSLSGSGDSHMLAVDKIRVLDLSGDESLDYEYLDTTAASSTMLDLTIARATSSDPFQLEGNGLHVLDYSAENLLVNEHMSGSDTVVNEVEFFIEVDGAVTVSSATVSGTGITDGTLTESQGSADEPDEWFAFVDASTSGPSPFAAVLGSLATGSSYGFSVVTTAGTDSLSRTLVAPDTGLFPTTTSTSTADGLFVSWTDIGRQMTRPVSEINVTVVYDNSGVEEDIFERESMPPGSSWLIVDEAIFTSGQTYTIEVEYVDVAGGVQVYSLELVYP